jgi:hypothetical protein
MDGSVDTLMDNSSSCPQAAPQADHKLTHDGSITLQKQDLYPISRG